MGYLDSTSITVDAVLTKKGRQLISGGGQLAVNFFSLSDTGVDYNLWNPDHTSGSAYYGEAIENLPQVEALPNSQYALRNKRIYVLGKTSNFPLSIAFKYSISILVRFSIAFKSILRSRLKDFRFLCSSAIIIIIQCRN